MWHFTAIKEAKVKYDRTRAKTAVGNANASLPIVWKLHKIGLTRNVLTVSGCICDNPKQINTSSCSSINIYSLNKIVAKMYIRSASMDILGSLHGLSVDVLENAWRN